MSTMDRYWYAAISELNEYVKQLRLDGVSVIRRKDEDGTDFVYVCRNVHTLDAPFPPFKGYAIPGTIPETPITPHDIGNLKEKIKMFLDGAAYILRLNHFHAGSGPDNSEKFRRLAQGFETIYNSAEVNDIERVNNFLWKHPDFVFPIEQALNQVRSKLNRNLKAEVGMVGTHSLQSGPGKDFIQVHILLNSAEEQTLFEEFVEEWWRKEVDPANEELKLTYGKEWEDKLTHFV